jgi:predicted aldo/keto reductase-like oxidoreductase
MKKNDIKPGRRKFLSNTFLGLTAFGFSGISNTRFKWEKAISDLNPSKSKIIYRKLGKTDIEMPIVSMGVMNAFFPELIKKSYEIGMRHFDTAANYGDGSSEEGLGEAIKDLNARNNVIISTKAMYGTLRRGLTQNEMKDRFLEIFDGSLKRLQTNYVDILYLHDCTTGEDVKNPGIIEAFEILKKEKKIRYAGVSTHRGSTDVINEVIKFGYHNVIEVALNFTYADYNELIESIKTAYQNGIGIVAMKTQGGGRWWVEINPKKWDIKDINQTAALKWVLKNESITTAIPGYTNYDQMNENFSVAFDLEYTPAEKEFLVKQKALLGMNFCRQCEQCLHTCPKGVHIPTLMRTHMYAAQYCNFFQARNVYNELPDGKNLISCQSCDSCIAKCPRSFNIADRIKELKLIYS